MEDRCSDIGRGASGLQGSGESSAARAGKARKSRTLSTVLGGGREAAERETASAWTGEKKLRIQNTSTSGDLAKVAQGDTGHSSGVVHEHEKWPEQIEGIHWDEDKLCKETDYYFNLLHPGLPDNDDEFWDLCDEQQLTSLNQRLALYRIRAHEEKYRGLDDASLKEIFHPSILENNGYYQFYEARFEWYFDHEYCMYARLQDYQRLMLRNNGEYEEWEYYRTTCNTLEGDQEFVQLWEKLLSNAKLIELLTKRPSERTRMERVVFYHAVKIAAGLPHVSKNLICSGFNEFVWSVQFGNAWYSYYADFYFEVWELIAKRKMNFKEALKHVFDKGKYPLCSFPLEESDSHDRPPSLIEQDYKRFLDRIGEKAEEGEAYQLIMDAVKKMLPRRKKYYDYAKKKLGIAKEIGLIPDKSSCDRTVELHAT